MKLYQLQNDVTEMLLSDVDISAYPELIDYRDKLFACLSERLRQIYQNLLYHMKDDDFSDLVFNYVEHYPSRSANVIDYGEHVHLFLAKMFIDERYRYWVDVAKYDWIVSRVLLMPSIESASIEKILLIPDESTLLFYTGQYVIDVFDYPVVECLRQNVWQIDSTDKKYYLFYRRESNVEYQLLNQSQYEMINSYVQLSIV